MLNFIASNIGKAFSVMAEFEVIPGMSLLAFLIILLVLHTIFDIFWFGAKSFERSDISYLANRTREARWNRNNRD